MAKKIKMIPDMPPEIIDAIDDNKLLIFVGAGLSKLFGYPLWNEYANALIEKCVETKAISRSDKSVLKNSNFTSMQLVTIAFDRLKEKVGEEGAQIIAKEELVKDKEKGHETLVKEISEYLSNYNSPIITTNADLSLDNSKSFAGKEIVKDFKKWDKDSLPYTDIIHLHGVVEDFNTMVFTSEQYASAYMAEEQFGKNLLELFKEDRTVLFIGYGVAEFELIRYFLKAKNRSKNNLFMLSGYLENEDIKRKFDKTYFQSLGIEVLPFSKEKNDFLALNDVLKKWNKDVLTKTMAHLKPINVIKKALANKPNEKSLSKIRSYL